MEVKELKKDVDLKEKRQKEGRMVISVEAETAIAEFVDTVNDDYFAGKATRYDAASFMLLWFKKHASSDAIFELRRRLADGFSMLDALQKQYKAQGNLPPDLQAALDRHFFGDAAKETRKSKKTLNDKSTIGRLEESEAP